MTKGKKKSFTDLFIDVDKSLDVVIDKLESDSSRSSLVSQYGLQDYGHLSQSGIMAQNRYLKLIVELEKQQMRIRELQIEAEDTG